jgi:peptidoglycan/LPS O-acetylase OafA/YrhL
MSERRLRTRPSVRGIIASHAGIFGIGWIGVIFFGLSGYLITGSMPGGIELAARD